MPRKLPWLQSTAAGAPRAHVASTPKPDGKTGSKTYRSDSGVSPISPLPVSVKRRRRADTAESPRLVHRHNDTDRALSSSPVPAPEAPQRPVEPMRNALTKYDLCDDEWMMVEDELLQTAKSFTRHLHLAEYERLKQDLQTRKVVVRPVIANAKPSEEGKLRMRIEAQRKAQRKALEEVAEATSEESGDDLDAPVRASFSLQHISTTRQKAASTPSMKNMAPPARTTRHAPASNPPSTTPNPSRSIQSIFTQKPQARKEADAQTSNNKPSSNPPKRPAKTSLFSLLDDLDTPFPSTSTSKPPAQSSHKPSSSPKNNNIPTPPRRKPLDFLDDIDADFPSSKHRVSNVKDTSSRVTKRRVEDVNAGKKEKKVVRVDEIPTFLF